MQSFSLVIFGVTSNLAQIKLIPALYDLFKNNLLPNDFKVIGIGRTAFTRLRFEQYVDEILHKENRHHRHTIEEHIHKKLIRNFSYLEGDFTDHALYEKIKKETHGKNKMLYMATFPDLYPTIFEHIQKSGLNKKGNLHTRLIIEKPLGVDFASAHALNNLLKKYFDEDQIFRLDHYLGKETLQNILSFRFGNSIFEPLMNKEYIDHIQITVSEDFGIGERGRYYDTVGAFKDVGQNHLLQMLALATMDVPDTFSNEEITKKRSQIIKDLIPHPKDIVFGQYEGYSKEKYIEENSQTDTYFAFKTHIDNERFSGVPVYMRGGKKLKKTVAEIVIVFKHPKDRLLQEFETMPVPNVLIYRVQPNEGIVLGIVTKKPGHKMEVSPNYMQFCYSVLPHELPDPYEKLLFDAMQGNQIFFIDAPEAEAQWKFSDQLSKVRGKPFVYKPGSWGPREADILIEKDGRKWIEPSIEFC